MSPSPVEKPVPGHNGYWRAVTRFTFILLGVWALVSLVAGILLVEPLNGVRVGRLPAGFWMAQQGSIVVFVALIFVYAKRMDRLDHAFRKDVDDPDPGERRQVVISDRSVKNQDVTSLEEGNDRKQEGRS